MQKFGIGQPVARFEDPRLLRGEGRYLADIDLPGQAYAVILRSPHAHARINAINAASVQAAAQKYLDAENYALAVAGPIGS